MYHNILEPPPPPPAPVPIQSMIDRPEDAGLKLNKA